MVSDGIFKLWTSCFDPMHDEAASTRRARSATLRSSCQPMGAVRRGNRSGVAVVANKAEFTKKAHAQKPFDQLNKA